MWRPNPTEAACKGTSASSYFGDNSQQAISQQDEDTFLLDGQQEDEITVTLEADGERGSNGGIAGLRIRGNSIFQEVEGTLPLEISVILPMADTYSIEIKQPKKPKDERFRGNYILNSVSTAGIQSMKPTNDVEN